MTNFFTRVKKNVQKNAETVSRLLGRSAENHESHAFWGAGIRDMGTKVIQKNRITALADGDLSKARVLPRMSWLQQEAIGLLANARHSSCQPATALGMGCEGIIT